jgi:hypothetical protein
MRVVVGVSLNFSRRQEVAERQLRGGESTRRFTPTTTLI